jgi:hypothetical protein
MGRQIWGSKKVLVKEPGCKYPFLLFHTGRLDRMLVDLLTFCMDRTHAKVYNVDLGEQ